MSLNILIILGIYFHSRIIANVFTHKPLEDGITFSRLHGGILLLNLKIIFL